MTIRQTNHFMISKTIYSILHRVSVSGFEIEELQAHPGLSYGIRIKKGPLVLAQLGEVRKSVCLRLGIKVPVYYGEVSFDAVLARRSGKSTGEGDQQIPYRET